MIFDPILDLFRGKAVTIPPLDGAFRPNALLDDADALLALPGADNLAAKGGSVLASAGSTLHTIDRNGQAAVAAEYDQPISAIAVSPGGVTAVALDSGDLFLDGAKTALPSQIGCITALAFDADGSLWIANGASGLKPSQWVRDLMAKGSSGSVWKLDIASGSASKVAGGLAYPYGLLPVAGGVVVSEAWRHRVVRIAPGGQVTTAIDNLPGYPARLSPAEGGGAWLSIFAPRNRLIEFVLQERHYREDMLASVPPEFWIAPALASGESFLEPLQCGGIKTMGVHKPWSPSRSYGLVVRLGADLRPVSSMHSRANGSRHGTTSAVEIDGRLLVASKGGGCVVALQTAGVQ